MKHETQIMGGSYNMQAVAFWVYLRKGVGRYESLDTLFILVNEIANNLI